MRVRILFLALLLVVAADLDIVLWSRPPAVSGPEPVMVIHDQPELALDEESAGFSEGIRTALVAKRYDDLETLAARLRDPDQRFRGGTSQITRFYEIVTEHKTIVKDKPCNRAIDLPSFDDRRAQLEAWHAALPDRPTAAVALAKLWGDAALRARGCGYVNETTEAQFAEMRTDFDKARHYFEEIDVDQDPVAAFEFIEMGMFLGWERGTLDELYARAMKAYPTYYTLYGQHAVMLQEKWQGGPGELEAYLDSVRAPDRGDEGQIAYAFIAYRLLQNFAQPRSTDADGLTFPAIVAAYQVRERRFGLRPHDWKALFYFSLRAGRCVIGHQAVQHMGTEWDDGIWSRREYFDKDIAWYKANTPFRADVGKLGG
jgi:Domain of unknown function (DUF4034)